MRYLASFLMLLSLGLFAVGCAKEQAKEAPPAEEKVETPTEPTTPEETPTQPTTPEEPAPKTPAE